jgi:peptide/nickel transport system permease protein
MVTSTLIPPDSPKPMLARTSLRSVAAARLDRVWNADGLVGLIIRRVVGSVPLLFIVSIAAFSLTLLLPGNPAVAIAGQNPTAAQIAQASRLLHLNEPVPARYWDWIVNVLHGNLGTSVQTGQSVGGQLLQRAPITLSIAIGALLLAAVVGTTIGVIQARFAGRLIDRVLLFIVSVGLSIPNFWLAALLVSLFAVHFNWFPAIGYVGPSTSVGTWLHDLVLPVVTLAVYPGAEMARQIRNGLVNVLQRDYMRAARARGIGSLKLIGKHGLRNAAAPAITILGLRIGYLIAGSVIIEEIFVIPGMGAYTLQAISARDAPVIEAIVLLSAVIMVVANLAVDVIQSVMNPKVNIR